MTGNFALYKFNVKCVCFDIKFSFGILTAFVWKFEMISAMLGSYLIFDTQKLQQIPPKGVKYAVLCVQSGKFYTGQNFFTRAPPVVPATNMRYGLYSLRPHVLAHFVKSFRAYNVNSSSTLFPGNIQSNIKISFPNERFLIQLDYNLITKGWDHQEWDFSDPCIIKPRKHSFKCDVLLWKTLIRVSIEF